MFAIFDNTLFRIFKKLRLCLQSDQRVQRLLNKSDAGRHFQYSCVDKHKAQEISANFERKQFFKKCIDKSDLTCIF